MINEFDRILPQASNILVVDYDVGLITANTEKWTCAFSIICQFDVAINTRCQITFSNAGEIAFMDHWNAVVHAPTEGLFMQLWQQLPTIAVSFLLHEIIICLTDSCILILMCIWYFIFIKDNRTIAYLDKNKFPLRNHWASFSFDRF